MNWLGLSFGTLPGTSDSTEDEDAGAENRRRKIDQKRNKPPSHPKRDNMPSKDTPRNPSRNKTPSIKIRKPK